MASIIIRSKYTIRILLDTFKIQYIFAYEWVIHRIEKQSWNLYVLYFMAASPVKMVVVPIFVPEAH